MPYVPPHLRLAAASPAAAAATTPPHYYQNATPKPSLEALESHRRFPPATSRKSATAAASSDVVRRVPEPVFEQWRPSDRVLAFNPEQLLETIIKNCSDIVHMHVAERDIPHEMAKIVKKKPDFHVKEKILVLVDTWQEAFGGSQARYPQYYAAYQELLHYGVVFPKRPERSAPIFTPAKTRPLSTYHQSSKRHEAKNSLDGSESPCMSLTEMQNARGIMDVLSDMLSALDPEDKEGIKQEVILDLVQQCRTYRRRLVHLVNSTSDEDLLCEGLALNDDLHAVVAKYDAIAAGISVFGEKPTTLQALVDIDNPADTNQDQRPNTETSTSNQHPIQHLLLPAPPSPNGTGAVSAGGGAHIDLLSGEDFNTPTTENPLALVPVGEPAANSATEQNMLALPDMFFQSNDADYSQGAYFNPANPNAQVAPGMIPQEHSLDGDYDQDLPPPPWEVQPVPCAHTQPMQPGSFAAVGMYPQMMQSSHFGDHTMYAPSMLNNQQPGAYAYSQPMHGSHAAGHAAFPQQQHELHLYTSYAGSNEISQGMYGLSMRDNNSYANAGPSHQMPRPSKPEDMLFGDLVNMAKSKQNKPTVS